MKTNFLIMALCLLLFSCSEKDSLENPNEMQKQFDDYVCVAKGHSDFIITVLNNNKSTRSPENVGRIKEELHDTFFKSEEIPDGLKTEDFYKRLTELNIQERDSVVSSFLPNLSSVLKSIIASKLSPSEAKEVLRKTINNEYTEKQVFLTAIAYDSYDYWYNAFKLTKPRTRLDDASRAIDPAVYDIIISDIDGAAGAIYTDAALALLTGNGVLAASAILMSSGISSVIAALRYYFPE